VTYGCYAAVNAPILAHLCRVVQVSVAADEPARRDPIVLHTMVDTHSQCDKVVTDDRHQFKLTKLVTVDVQLRNFRGPEFEKKFQKEVP